MAQAVVCFGRECPQHMLFCLKYRSGCMLKQLEHIPYEKIHYTTLFKIKGLGAATVKDTIQNNWIAKHNGKNDSSLYLLS